MVIIYCITTSDSLNRQMHGAFLTHVNGYVRFRAYIVIFFAQIPDL